MITAYQGDQVDAIVQFDVAHRRRAVQRPELHAHRARRPPCIARSGCAPTRASSRTSKVRQALALTLGSRGARPAAVPGPGRGRPTTTSSGRAIRTSIRRVTQRTRDVERAKALLADAGARASPRRSMPASCRRSRTSPRSSRARPRRRASRSTSRSRASTRSMARSGARREPAEPAVLRRRRARHRRLRPPGHAGRLPERGAQDQGHLELIAVRVESSSTRRSPSSRRPSASRPRRRRAPRSRPSSTGRSRSACRTSTTTSPELEQVHRGVLERPGADVLRDDVTGRLTRHRVRAAALPPPPAHQTVEGTERADADGTIHHAQAAPVTPHVVAARHDRLHHRERPAE